MKLANCENGSRRKSWSQKHMSKHKLWVRMILHLFVLALLSLTKTAEERGTGWSREKGRETEGGLEWGGPNAFSLPSVPLVVVTLATLLEFHKSLRCSRKWLLGFGMLFPGHCRHCWSLFCLLNPPPLPDSPPSFPFLPRSLFSSSFITLLQLNIYCGNYFYG